MFTKISFADLHSPLFLGGKNLGQKLDPKKVTGLILQYDTEEKRLWIEYNGKTCFFGIEGAVHPENPEDFGYKTTDTFKEPKAKVTTAGAPMVASVSRTAQVETPMSRPPTPPGLRNKYQGQ